MSSSPTNDGERPGSETDSRRFSTAGTPLLRLRIIDAPDGPSRATLYPADAADIVRMETWLTVDAGVVCDLSNCR